MKKLNIILTILLFMGLILLFIGISCKNEILVAVGILGSLTTYCICQLVRFTQEIIHQHEDKGESNGNN